MHASKISREKETVYQHVEWMIEHELPNCCLSWIYASSIDIAVTVKIKIYTGYNNT